MSDGMMFDGFHLSLPDTDPAETQEWIDSFDAVNDAQGRARASYLLMRLIRRAQAAQIGFPASVSTPYVNTIAVQDEPWFPGDEEMERRIRRIVRWNAAVMVSRANRRSEGIGGHLATYASSASLLEVGFNHFFRGSDDGGAGDQVFFQGHAAPGVYSRAFLEGRLSETELDKFRFESKGGGLSSYPHPRLMPHFWQFPTVSMGIGPLNAIYQARFNRYLHNRRLVDTSNSHVWCFMGDGESDEPESLGALSVAAREQLDNLTFVVNCNLQRLDGPVRGNGKIIQELEAVFRGAGWNVIKVIWGSKWDDLIARDIDGVLVNKMNSTVDGWFQKYETEPGSFTRQHFFGPDPRLQKMVEHLSDDELANLPRGGHDYRKLYAAYKAAMEHKGQPTVILVKTVKGWTLGPDIESRNATHQIKKMTKAQLATLRDRLKLTDVISDETLNSEDLPPYYHPGPDSPEVQYMLSRRQQLDGSVPKRTDRKPRLKAPEDKCFSEFDSGSKNQAVSTMMAFAKLLKNMLRDKQIGKYVVPIIPDEARTFGMDGLFSEVKIYAPFGQKYEPVDAGMQLSYKESQQGQILQEGITEAGAMASTTAAGTAYATHNQPMIPMYAFYSMFGFQRVGDFIWAFGDMRGRGFLIGGTAGRTTINGEGLQHEDGHSHVMAATIPNLMAYDPAFAYELATLMKDGIRRMYGTEGNEQEDVFYYLTTYNENYPQPALPEHLEAEEVRKGIIDGIYQFSPAPEGLSRKVTLLFSGTAHQAARDAKTMLAEKYGVAAELYSVTSFKRLRDDALAVERWNRLHPTEKARTALITDVLGEGEGPVVAVTDYMKMVPDMVSRFVPRQFVPLGTDGYGRSDTREALRAHFEVNAAHVVVAALYALATEGKAEANEVTKAIVDLGIDTDKIEPRLA